MRKPVISIMLDSLEISWLERWIDAGHLPTLAKLRAESARCAIHGMHPFTGELAHVTFLTSATPERMGYWGAFNYDVSACKPLYIRGPDYTKVRNFYDDVPDLKVCQFDFPKSGFAPTTRGIQVLNWGAHGSLNDSCSNPRPLFSQLEEKYGRHPALEKDHVEPWQSRELDELFSKLISGVRLRTRIHRDLLARENWDLFLTSYSEFHSAGHCYMHLEDLSYPLYQRKAAAWRMLEIAKEIDASIADLLSIAPTDAAISLFSLHGMVMNGWDVNSMYFLPELLHRLAFPKRIRKASGAVPPPSVGDFWWADSIWKLTFGNTRPKPRMDEGINWIPGNWYASDWPAMKAFAIPGFDEGMLRLNVKGRDPYGCVETEDYDEALNDLSRLISDLTDARTGKPLVARFFRTRSDPLDDGPHLPPADLIVEWTQEPCDVADSSFVGRLGPVPLRRTGGHSRNGFAWFKDDRLSCGDRSPATPYDLGPTLLDLNGAEQPRGLNGRSLMRDWRERPERALFDEFEMKAAPAAWTGKHFPPASRQFDKIKLWRRG
jgi:predicted AlkP superfamily phosphohydrolase/phosphomutase